MFRKINTKLLLLLFAVLALIVIVVMVYDRRKGERSFRSDLFTVDSVRVTAITIYPKGKIKPEIMLVKTGNSWEIKSNNKTYPADTGIIQNVLHMLGHVKPERVSGTDRSSWKELEITDSLSTRVVVEQNKEVAADFRLGKISFMQNSGMQDYGGNRNITIKSHIRVAGDDRVYVVNGYLGSMFSGQLSQYRIRTVIRLNKTQLSKLTFSYPGDSSFVLVRNGNKWFVNDQPADSTSVERYLNSIAYAINSEFADDAPFYTHQLRIEGNSMQVINVKGAFDPQSKKYFVTSSCNPSAIFSSANASLFHQVFASESGFNVKKVEEKKTVKHIKK
jgi:hypothetical protein